MPKDNKDFFKQKKEWSEIKDTLLGCYLPQYFQKVLMTRLPIVYVDCFAGKGCFDDGKDGSPRIALSVRADVLRKTTAKNPKIDTYFIDLNHASELQANIADYQECSPQVISGRFEVEIEQLLNNKMRSNVFLYIDPYGYQALDFALLKRFAATKLSSIELLINMNSFGLLRDAFRVMKVTRQQTDEAFTDLDEIIEYDPAQIDVSTKSEELVTAVCGGDYWKAIVRDYNAGMINGYQAEERLSIEYRNRLKQEYTYVLDMPIRLKEGNRPKYRMIHATNHEAGCYLMAQNMQNRSKELFTNIQHGGMVQLNLFDSDDAIIRSGATDYISVEEIKQKITHLLQQYQEGVRLTKFIAVFVNEHNLIFEFKALHEILTELQEAGQICIVREPSTTTLGNASAFWEEKNGQTITLRGVNT